MGVSEAEREKVMVDVHTSYLAGGVEIMGLSGADVCSE